MKLILTRHGETIENEKGILQGHLNGKLNSLGILQAKKLGFRLKNEKIDAIYSSDLTRAFDTAREIAKYHPGINIELCKELRERNNGDFEGKHKDLVDWNNPPKNIEAPEDMRARAMKMLDLAYKKYPAGTVVFVAHGMINNVLLTILLKKPLEERLKLEKQHNTAVNIFEIKEDKNHVVNLLNCIKHLK